jgi:hypothetical protein
MRPAVVTAALALEVAPSFGECAPTMDEIVADRSNCDGYGGTPIATSSSSLAWRWAICSFSFDIYASSAFLTLSSTPFTKTRGFVRAVTARELMASFSTTAGGVSRSCRSSQIASRMINDRSRARRSTRQCSEWRR